MDKYDDHGTWEGNIFYTNSSDSIATAYITNEMLEDFGYINKGDTLIPVSSAHQEKWYDPSNSENATTVLPQFTKQPTQTNIRGDALAVNEDRFGYYYQFEFFMRSSTAQRLYMFLNEETTIDADAQKNQMTSRSTSLDYLQLNDVENYLRLSVLSHNGYMIYEPHPNLLDDDSYEQTRFFGRMDVDARDGVFDFDAWTYKEIVYGNITNEDKIVYGEEARVQNEPFNFWGGGFTGNTYQNAEAVDIEKSLENGMLGAVEQTVTPDVIGDKSNGYQSRVDNALAILEGREPTRIVVSIWAEGWDRDCNLLSQDASFVANLVFNARDQREMIGV